MITFRCTAKLARRFDLVLDASDDAKPGNLLGDWYANLFNLGPQRWVLCLNEQSNLPVLVPARKADFPARFPEVLTSVLRTIGVPEEDAVLEARRSSEIRFGKTLSRSLLGSLNDMAIHMSWELEGRRGDSVMAAAALSEMPCRHRNFIFPGEVAFSLLGIPALYDRTRNRRLFHGDWDDADIALP